MENLTGPGWMSLVPPEVTERNGTLATLHEGGGRPHVLQAAAALDPEFLRCCAWEIGAQQPADRFAPAANHVALAMVSPYHGFVHWRLQHAWIEETARQRGPAWHNCRMVVRLYDVSFIEFDGMNAHRLQDHPVSSICGQLFFNLPRPGTWQLAEVGFVLCTGEFIPGARSAVVSFPSDSVSPRCNYTALLVNGRGRVEEVGNIWEQEKILNERRKPQLRSPLRLAILAFESLPSGQDGLMARFVSEMAAGQASAGHEPHVFVPANDRLPTDSESAGVHYHPLAVNQAGTPVERALRFARAVSDRMEALPPFDLVHVCEWMAGLAPWIGSGPTVLSLGSIETTRRDGNPANDLSQEIQQIERELAHTVDCILLPDWLRDQALVEFGIDAGRVHGFPMEARLPDAWDCPLDTGHVKKQIGFGPLDRLMVFIGPLEYHAGPDLLIEALPVLLRRTGNVRLALVGTGSMHGQLEHRARELGLSFAVHLLGHVELAFLIRVLRAAEALVLPSRGRVAQDEAVVDLARRAARPVVTTHGGPAHLVRHEETGIVSYDNPGSVVWALDRILGDPVHAEWMGRKARHQETPAVRWQDAVRRFLEICADSFPELRAHQD